MRHDVSRMRSYEEIIRWFCRKISGEYESRLKLVPPKPEDPSLSPIFWALTYQDKWQIRSDSSDIPEGHVRLGMGKEKIILFVGRTPKELFHKMTRSDWISWRGLWPDQHGIRTDRVCTHTLFDPDFRRRTKAQCSIEMDLEGVPDEEERPS